MLTRKHTHATEFVIIISQTVFYVVLFLFFKKTLLDNQKLITTRNKIIKKLPLILSIIFTIYAIIFILMLPCLNYIYAEIVFVLTYFIITLILIKSVRQAYQKSVDVVETREDSDVDENETPVDQINLFDTEIADIIPAMKSRKDGFKSTNRLKF